MEEVRGSYLSASVRVELEADGARYQLAPRKVGAIRHLGWVLVGLGGVLSLGVLAVARSFAAPWLEDGLPDPGSADSVGGWIALGALLIGGLIGLSIAFRMLRFGLFVVAGRSEVRLRAGRLVGIEHGGPLRRSRRGRAAEVRRLLVTEVMGGASGAQVPSGLPPLARLEAVLESGRKLSLAVAYPADELEVLARDLAERIPSASVLAGGAVTPAPAVERVGRSPGAGDSVPEAATGDSDENRRRADEEVSAHPPAGSAIQVERTGGGLIVRVPPAGLMRGSHGLFAFGVLWSFLVLLLGGGVLGAELGGGGSGDLGWAGALAFLSVFAAIGAAMLWFGARAGTRRTTIEIAPPVLRVTSVALGRVREETLEVRELRAIAVGPSGVRVNNRDLLELKLHAAGRRPRGLLRERRDEELEWLAALLRSELDLPPRPGAATAPGSSTW